MEGRNWLKQKKEGEIVVVRHLAFKDFDVKPEAGTKREQKGRVRDGKNSAVLNQDSDHQRAERGGRGKGNK